MQAALPRLKAQAIPGGYAPPPAPDPIGDILDGSPPDEAASPPPPTPAPARPADGLPY
jgi:penicillin-binding protein 1A